MAMKKIKDAVYAAEKYTDNSGNEKTRYVNVGALLERDDGSLTLKMEAVPVQFSGWINFYDPKPRDGQPQQRPQARQAERDPFDDVPFD